MADARAGQVTWSRIVTFREVAERGSVRAAARALHVTEPAVSSAVSAVERQLGTELLRREGRNVVLTSAGTVFAEYCRTLLALADEAARATGAADRPRLRLGAVSAAAEYVLPRVLVAHRRAHPEVETTVTVLPRDELFAALRHHELDVVVAGRPPRGSALQARASRANRLVVIGAPGAGGPDDSPWLLRSPGSGMRTATLALLGELGLAPELLELGSHGATVAGARAGLGVTLAHEDAVGGDLAAGRLVAHPVEGTPLDRPWIVSTTARAPASAVAFVRLLGRPDAVGGDAFHLRGRPGG